MALSFPSSPSVGATSTQNGRQYQWSGYAWELVAASGGGEDAVLRALFVPGAPTSVTATGGNTQATVSWTAPTGVITQAPVTDYVVQFQPSGGSWSTVSDGTSTASSAVVTGLTNGTAYQFRVAAVNSIGQGSYSTASAAAVPSSNPIASASGLWAWYDASSAGTLYDSKTGGSLVSADSVVKRWEDRSGNNRHAVLQLDSRNSVYTGPTLRSSIQNNLPALQFGVNAGGEVGYGLDIADGIGLVSSGATMFLVSRVASGNYGAPLAKAGGYYNGWWLQIKSSGYAPELTFKANGSSGGILQGPSWPENFTLMTLSVPANNALGATMYLNGSAVSVNPINQGSSAPPSTSYPVTLGYAAYDGGSVSDYRWAGYIGEVVMCEQQLSSTVISQINQVLMTKWGIS